MIEPHRFDTAHMAWMSAEIESEHRLREWFAADVHDRSNRYAAYLAALDQEAAAAADLQRLRQSGGAVRIRPVAVRS